MKSNTSPARSSLLIKAAALLAAPLLFNVIWMSIFWSGIVAAGKMLDEEQTERRLFSDQNNMIVAYYECYDTSVMWALTRKLQWEKITMKNYSEFRQLYRKTIDNPRLNEAQKNILNQADSFLSNNFAAAQANGDLYNQAEMFVRRKRALAADTQKYMNREHFLAGLFAPQEQRLAQLEAENLESQKRLILLAVSGLLVNIIGTLAFAFVFMRSFKTRLQLLVLHAEQLGKRTAMGSGVSGSDELTVVDEAMRQSAKQLENVFSFKRMLTEMMAHDLRSPLTSALVSIETVLARSTTLSEAETKRLESVQSSVLRSASLVDDMLVLDSLETGNLAIEKKNFDIDELIEECTMNLQGNATVKGIKFNLKVEPREVFADSKRIAQVLTNLISNAIKFAPKDSEVVVESKEAPGELKISVRDFGTGIKAEELERVFEKYYRSDKHKEVVGTGLGLAICKMIVESHDGRIGCLSNNGAIFWFTIPNDKQPETEEQPPSEVAAV